MLPFISGNLPGDHLTVLARFVARAQKVGSVGSGRLTPNVSGAQLLTPERPGAVVFPSDLSIAEARLPSTRCLIIAAPKALIALAIPGVMP